MVSIAVQLSCRCPPPCRLVPHGVACVSTLCRLFNVACRNHCYPGAASLFNLPHFPLQHGSVCKLLEEAEFIQTVTKALADSKLPSLSVADLCQTFGRLLGFIFQSSTSHPQELLIALAYSVQKHVCAILGSRLNSCFAAGSVPVGGDLRRLYEEACALLTCLRKSSEHTQCEF